MAITCYGPPRPSVSLAFGGLPMRYFSLTRRLLFLGCLALGFAAFMGQAETEAKPHVAELLVHGAIGPATTDYLTRSMDQAHEQGAKAVLIRNDTPGGLDEIGRASCRERGAVAVG